MLHTVNKSPYEKNSLEACLGLSLPGSDILLIEDGVYGAIAGSAAAGKLAEVLKDRQVYVLGSDLKARGIDAAKLIDGVKVVDYSGFVELAASNDRVQAWL
jgi:tRNA 2-thiouridine synthesizing protein B